MKRRSVVATMVAAGLLLVACSPDAADETSLEHDVAETVEDGGSQPSADDAAAEAQDQDSDAAQGADDEADDDGYRYFELGETAVVDSYDYDFEITVHDVTFTDTLPGELAEERRLLDTFYIAELTLRNTGDTGFPVQRLRPDLVLRDSLDVTGNATLPLDEEAAVERLEPGKELTGRYWGDTRVRDSYYFGFVTGRGGNAQWFVPGE